MANPNQPPTLSPPPKFQSQTNPIIGPQTPDEWAQFWRWLYAQYVTVTYLAGSDVPPTTFPSFPPQQPDPGDIIALISGFHQASAPRRESPQIPQGFPSVPYPTRGQSWLLDTYTNWTSANYLPAVYQPGQPFLVTTWNVVYAIQLVAGTATWVYESGVYIAATGSRPTTGFSGAALGTADTGLLFLDSTLTQMQYWTGAAWVVVPNIPTSATVLASNANKQVTAAALTKGSVWAGDGSNLPASLAVGANGKVLTANSAATNGVDYEAPVFLTTTGTSGAATLTPGNPYALNIPNYATAAGITGTWTPGVQFNGGTTGITYTLQTGRYFSIGNMVFAFFDIILSSKGSSTGFAEVTGLPAIVSATYMATGGLSFYQDMVGIQATPSALANVGTDRVVLLDFTSTDGVTLDDTNFSNTGRIVGMVIYYS